MTVPAKQIIKLIAAFVRIEAFSVTGSSANVTTAITTALGTAGEGGVSVPVQTATATRMGIITTAPTNRCTIYGAVSDDQILVSGVSVYGRLTEAAGVYTLSFFTLSDAGVESAHSFAAATSIDFEFGYRYDFARWPSDAVIGVTTRNVGNDPAGATATAMREALTPTGANTLPALSRTPINTSTFELIVNGLSYDTFGGASAMVSVDLNTRAVSWSATNAGFSLATSDRVVADYLTNE
jgi:hypothetical protein